MHLHTQSQLFLPPTFYILCTMDQVDIILPTHNRLNTLPRAIESVIHQTHSQWTLWIVDDGSTDRTVDWVRQFLTQNPDPRIHLITQEQRGVSAARNTGIRAGTHPWIALLDSDDEWLPEKLEQQIQEVHKDGNRWCHGEEIWIRNGQRVNAAQKHQKAGGWQFLRSLELCCISPSAVLIARDLLEQCGLFDEAYPVCEDFELWLRLTLRAPISYVTQPVIRKYGGHADQLSRRYHSMDYWRIRAVYDLFEKKRTQPDQREWTYQALCSVLQRSAILMSGNRKHWQFGNWNEIHSYRIWAEDNLALFTTHSEAFENS